MASNQRESDDASEILNRGSDRIRPADRNRDAQAHSHESLSRESNRADPQYPLPQNKTSRDGIQTTDRWGPMPEVPWQRPQPSPPCPPTSHPTDCRCEPFCGASLPSGVLDGDLLVALGCLGRLGQDGAGDDGADNDADADEPERGEAPLGEVGVREARVGARHGEGECHAAGCRRGASKEGSYRKGCAGGLRRTGAQRGSHQKGKRRSLDTTQGRGGGDGTSNRRKHLIKEEWGTTRDGHGPNEGARSHDNDMIASALRRARDSHRYGL